MPELPGIAPAASDYCDCGAVVDHDDHKDDTNQPSLHRPGSLLVLVARKKARMVSHAIFISAYLRCSKCLQSFSGNVLMLPAAELSGGLSLNCSHANPSSKAGELDVDDKLPVDLTAWMEGVFEPPASSHTDRPSTNSSDLAPVASCDLTLATPSHPSLASAMFGDDDFICAKATAISQRHDEFLMQTILLLLQNPALMQHYLDAMEPTGAHLALEAIQYGMNAVQRGMYMTAIISNFLYLQLPISFRRSNV